MSRTELNAKIKELRELRRMADELAAEIETITDTVKQEMQVQGVDTLTGDDWRATWKTVQSSRFDSKAFLRLHSRICTARLCARSRAAGLCWHKKSSLPKRRSKQAESL